MSNTILFNILVVSATILTISISAISTLRYIRRKRIKTKNILSLLLANQGYNRLSYILTTAEKIDESEILSDFEKTNNFIKSVFDEITNSRCRTTIKVISYDDSIPIVLSLASQNDEKRPRQQIWITKSKLFDDTSLSVLFNRPFDYYLENNLEKFYKNIFVPSLSDQKIVIYMSTLVVPIIRYEIEKSKSCNIYGFLSIDCETKNAFKKDFHVDIAKSFASKMAPLIETWTKKVALQRGLVPNTDSAS
jgi:hypothetical protein